MVDSDILIIFAYINQIQLAMIAILIGILIGVVVLDFLGLTTVIFFYMLKGAVKILRGILKYFTRFMFWVHNKVYERFEKNSQKILV